MRLSFVKISEFRRGFEPPKLLPRYATAAHKHCDKAATNANGENARSIMEASSAGKRGYGDKGR
jgi:hypothetical protein